MTWTAKASDLNQLSLVKATFLADSLANLQAHKKSHMLALIWRAWHSCWHKVLLYHIASAVILLQCQICAALWPGGWWSQLVENWSCCQYSCSGIWANVVCGLATDSNSVHCTPIRQKVSRDEIAEALKPLSFLTPSLWSACRQAKSALHVYHPQNHTFSCLLANLSIHHASEEGSGTACAKGHAHVHPQFVQPPESGFWESDGTLSGYLICKGLQKGPSLSSWVTHLLMQIESKEVQVSSWSALLLSKPCRFLSLS